MRAPFDFPEPEKRSIEDPTVKVSASNFLAFFGVQSAYGPAVTLDNALTVPAVAAAVSFLSASMANLPLHAYRDTGEGSERIRGPLQRIVNEAPNDEWTSFGARKYFWQQVFTAGRGLFWIERSGTGIAGLWPMEVAKTTVVRQDGRKVYQFGGRTYPAADVIDVPFLLKPDQLSVASPIMLAAKTISLALAMNDYAAGFFAGGGVPPLALTGPLPQGAAAMGRAMDDVSRAITAAKASNKPVFPMPPGHDLKQVGFDPAKGQMTEAMRFIVEEIARAYSLPPVFLQDLTHGTFSNTEQQDLHLTKHLIAQWAKALEEEMNLKLFGAKRNVRYVEHSLDGMMRGDFKSRLEGLSTAVNTALLTPNEARALDNREGKPNGDDLYIQGATVKLGSQVAPPSTGATDDPGA